MPRFRRTPDIVKALGERVKSWGKEREYLEVFLKDSHFDSLYIRNIPMTFDFDRVKWMFLCQLEIVPRERIEEHKKLYPIFESLQCEMAWRTSRFFRKNPYFKPLSKAILPKDKSRIEGQSRRLIDALNGKSNLIELIKKTKIDALSVTLSKHVASITWIIRLTTGLIRSFGYVSRVNKVYDILNLTSKTVLEVSEEICRNLASEKHLS